MRVKVIDFQNRNHVYMSLVFVFFLGTVAFTLVFLRTTLDYISSTQEGLSQIEYKASSRDL